MSVHINAKEGQIADIVLLPGDPLRAKYIAETFLEDVICYNEVRGMYGFTGTYQGRRISVQGTGMGVPSIAIYITELIQSYGVKTLIRVGTCGGLSTDVQIRDVVLAMSSSTDSSMNRNYFGNIDFAPTANFDLLYQAYQIGSDKGLKLKCGNVFTSDIFYDTKRDIQALIDHQVLAVEMETTALYSIAQRFNCQALSILTVSDHLITGEETSAEERQTTFNDMIEVALDTVIKIG